MGADGASPVQKTPAAKAVAGAVEEVGFGLYQLVPLFLTGGIFLAEGAEMLVMGSITSLLHRHWELNPAVRGGMVSIVFIGFSVGNFISGQIGDRFGRRTSILLAYAMIAFFGFATACSQGPGFMIFLRFFVGIGCGIGFPAAYSLMPEVAPSGWRSSLNTLMIGFMPLGELIGALVVLFVDPELDNSARGCSMDLYYPSRALMQPELCAWKTLCEMSAIPAFLFLILASKFLDESPQFLANCGRFEECEQVLQRMAKLNGSELDVEKLRVAFSAPDADEGGEPSPTSPSRSYSFRHVVAELCSDDFLPVVSFMCLAHVAKDFGVFGLSYMLPQYFVFLKNLTAGVELMVVATLAMPGVVLTYLCSRIPGVSLVYWMSGSAMLCSFFGVGMLTAAPESSAAPAAYMVKLLAMSYFVFTVSYTTAAFPARIRQTAVGICTAAGRMGSISAPLVFELSKEVTGSFDFFVGCLMSLMATVSLLAPLLLPKWGQEEEPLLIESDGAKDYASCKSCCWGRLVRDMAQRCDRSAERATGVRRLAFCGAVWLASESFTAFVPAGHQQRARSVRVSGATPAALLLATLSAEARADDSDAEGWSFNPFYIVAFLVVVGVVRLIGWVFSLKPEMDADADGYRSTTLRGRDSEENLQRRIAEMEARLALEEKQRQALIAGKATATRGQDDVDDDLFSSDLDAQLRAARNS
ncbi:svop [Symbiodinium microadriaticum]|nr:svop [Symbiodinium microadriaticum]CAE7948467.1 svop [Symbiodinium sp. KB8]